MKHINIKANFPGCGKSYTLQQLYSRDPFKRKYYITPQNKQVVDVVDRLKSINCTNPNVQTYAHFVGNWQVIKVEDQTFYIMTDKPSKRAPTKKQIDLFIDEYSSLSKKQIDVICQHFNVRNLITAGDAHQFEPIPYHNTIYETGSRTKVVAEYHDDGSLPNLPIDRQYVLSKNMRANNDPDLATLINAIKNADAESIFNAISSRVWNETKQASDLHIAYTNKLVDSINNDYANEFANKQYIVKNNDKMFGILKGALCDSTTRSTYIELKRNVFQTQYDEGQLNTTVDEALDSWADYTFGYSYAVTSHKLQGTTIEDRNIVIHLSDIINFILAVDNDKTLSPATKLREKAKRVEIFHKMLYVAVSRATSLSQIHFAQDIDEDSDKNIFPINFLANILAQMKPFVDDNIDNAIYTTSINFDYDECLAEFDTADLGFYNREIAEDAIEMPYKQFAAKHADISQRTWKRLRAKYLQVSNTPAIPAASSDDMGPRNVAYKETLDVPYLMAEAISSNEINSNMHTSFALAAASQPANSFSCLSSCIAGV